MRGQVQETIAASAAEVFTLTHAYDRRLQWDTLLSAAFLERGAREARVGAVATCIGRGVLRPFALTTEYVSFQPSKVAAVKLINRVPFFARWAASIRHLPGRHAGESIVVYTFNFKARPRFLAWLLEPLMLRVFLWETRKRLRSMRAHFSTRRGEVERAQPS